VSTTLGIYILRIPFIHAMIIFWGPFLYDLEQNLSYVITVNQFIFWVFNFHMVPYQ